MIHVPRLKAVVYVRYRVTRDGSIHSRRRAASISLKLGAVHEKHSVYTSVRISQDKHWCRLDWDCVECDGSAEDLTRDWSDSCRGNRFLSSIIHPAASHQCTRFSSSFETEMYVEKHRFLEEKADRSFTRNSDDGMRPPMTKFVTTSHANDCMSVLAILRTGRVSYFLIKRLSNHQLSFLFHLWTGHNSPAILLLCTMNPSQEPGSGIILLLAIIL